MFLQEQERQFVAITNDRSVTERQILTASGLQGQALEDLRAVLKSMDETQLQAKLAETLNGNAAKTNNQTEGLVLEHSASEVEKSDDNDDDTTTATDADGNEVAETKEDGKTIKKVITSKDKHTVNEIEYKDGKPTKKTVKKDGNTVETATYEYTENDGTEQVKITSTGADKTKTITTASGVDESGNVPDGKYIAQTKTNMAGITTTATIENGKIKESTTPDSEETQTQNVTEKTIGNKVIQYKDGVVSRSVETGSDGIIAREYKKYNVDGAEYTGVLTSRIANGQTENNVVLVKNIDGDGNYSYNDIVSNTIYDGNNKVSKVIYYTNGEISSAETYGGDEQPTSQSSYEYTPNGIVRTTTDGNNTVRVIADSVDSSGNLDGIKEQITRHADGSGVAVLTKGNNRQDVITLSKINDDFTYNNSDITDKKETSTFVDNEIPESATINNELQKVMNYMSQSNHVGKLTYDKSAIRNLFATLGKEGSEYTPDNNSGYERYVRKGDGAGSIYVRNKREIKYGLKSINDNSSEYLVSMDDGSGIRKLYNFNADGSFNGVEIINDKKNNHQSVIMYDDGSSDVMEYSDNHEKRRLHYNTNGQFEYSREMNWENGNTLDSTVYTYSEHSSDPKLRNTQVVDTPQGDRYIYNLDGTLKKRVMRDSVPILNKNNEIVGYTPISETDIDETGRVTNIPHASIKYLNGNNLNAGEHFDYSQIDNELRDTALSQLEQGYQAAIDILESRKAGDSVLNASYWLNEAAELFDGGTDGYIKHLKQKKSEIGQMKSRFVHGVQRDATGNITNASAQALRGSHGQDSAAFAAEYKKLTGKNWNNEERQKYLKFNLDSQKLQLDLQRVYNEYKKNGKLSTSAQATFNILTDGQYMEGDSKKMLKQFIKEVDGTKQKDGSVNPMASGVGSFAYGKLLEKHKDNLGNAQSDINKATNNDQNLRDTGNVLDVLGCVLEFGLVAKGVQYLGKGIKAVSALANVGKVAKYTARAGEFLSSELRSAKAINSALNAGKSALNMAATMGTFDAASVLGNQVVTGKYDGEKVLRTGLHGAATGAIGGAVMHYLSPQIMKMYKPESTEFEKAVDKVAEQAQKAGKTLTASDIAKATSRVQMPKPTNIRGIATIFADLTANSLVFTGGSAVVNAFDDSEIREMLKDSGAYTDAEIKGMSKKDLMRESLKMQGVDTNNMSDYDITTQYFSNELENQFKGLAQMKIAEYVAAGITKHLQGGALSLGKRASNLEYEYKEGNWYKKGDKSKTPVPTEYMSAEVKQAMAYDALEARLNNRFNKYSKAPMNGRELMGMIYGQQLPEGMETKVAEGLTINIKDGKYEITDANGKTKTVDNIEGIINTYQNGITEAFRDNIRQKIWDQFEDNNSALDKISKDANPKTVYIKTDAKYNALKADLTEKLANAKTDADFAALQAQAEVIQNRDMRREFTQMIEAKKAEINSATATDAAANQATRGADNIPAILPAPNLTTRKSSGTKPLTETLGTVKDGIREYTQEEFKQLQNSDPNTLVMADANGTVFTMDMNLNRTVIGRLAGTGNKQSAENYTYDINEYGQLQRHAESQVNVPKSGDTGSVTFTKNGIPISMDYKISEKDGKKILNISSLPEWNSAKLNTQFIQEAQKLGKELGADDKIYTKSMLSGEGQHTNLKALYELGFRATDKTKDAQIQKYLNDGKDLPPELDTPTELYLSQTEVLNKQLSEAKSQNPQGVNELINAKKRNSSGQEVPRFSTEEVIKLSKSTLQKYPDTVKKLQEVKTYDKDGKETVLTADEIIALAPKTGEYPEIIDRFLNKINNSKKKDNNAIFLLLDNIDGYARITDKKVLDEIDTQLINGNEKDSETLIDSMNNMNGEYTTLYGSYGTEKKSGRALPGEREVTAKFSQHLKEMGLSIDSLEDNVKTGILDSVKKGDIFNAARQVVEKGKLPKTVSSDILYGLIGLKDMANALIHGNIKDLKGYWNGTKALSHEMAMQLLNAGIPLETVLKDFELDVKYRRMGEYMKKNPDSELSNHLYENYYLKDLENSGIDKTVIDRCREINKKYNVKVMPGTDTSDAKATLDAVESELSKWHTASGGKAKLPPVFEFSTANAEWYDTTSAYGQGAAAAYSQPNYNGAQAYDSMRAKKVNYAMRHESTHTNDLKHLSEFYEQGFIIKDKNGNVDAKKCKFYDDFVNIGLSKDLISYAYNNPMEFIAVASQGDLSKASPEFKKQLVDFGMPEWELNLDSAGRTNQAVHTAEVPTVGKVAANNAHNSDAIPAILPAPNLTTRKSSGTKPQTETLGTVGKDGKRIYSKDDFNKLKANDKNVKQMPNGTVITLDAKSRTVELGKLADTKPTDKSAKTKENKVDKKHAEEKRTDLGPIKPSKKDPFGMRGVISDEYLNQTKGTLLVPKGKKFVLNPEADKVVFAASEQIRAVAKNAESGIVKFMLDMGLATDPEFPHRCKSVQSLHDKIQNALIDDKSGTLTLEKAINKVKDSVGVRTVDKIADIANDERVQKFVKAGDMKSARMMAVEIESDYILKALEHYIDLKAEGKTDMELTRISNYIGEDGIPYFTENQLSKLKAYAADKGIQMPVVERILRPEEQAQAKTEGTYNEDATTKVRESGYTALQMNFRTKDGLTYEWQYRGETLNKFAEGEHIPYDLRTNKDIIGVNTELTRLYEPMKELLTDKEKMDDNKYAEYNHYLTAHYEYLRMHELGFNDGKNPPKLPKGFDARLRAENLELLHETAEDIKKDPANEEKYRKEYEANLIQNTPDNVTTESYTKAAEERRANRTVDQYEAKARLETKDNENDIDNIIEHCKSDDGQIRDNLVTEATKLGNMGIKSEDVIKLLDMMKSGNIDSVSKEIKDLKAKNNSADINTIVNDYISKNGVKENNFEHGADADFMDSDATTASEADAAPAKAAPTTDPNAILQQKIAGAKNENDLQNAAKQLQTMPDSYDKKKLMFQLRRKALILQIGASKRNSLKTILQEIDNARDLESLNNLKPSVSSSLINSIIAAKKAAYQAAPNQDTDAAKAMRNITRTVKGKTITFTPIQIAEMQKANVDITKLQRLADETMVNQAGQIVPRYGIDGIYRMSDVDDAIINKFKDVRMKLNGKNIRLSGTEIATLSKCKDFDAAIKMLDIKYKAYNQNTRTVRETGIGASNIADFVNKGYNPETIQRLYNIKWNDGISILNAQGVTKLLDSGVDVNTAEKLLNFRGTTEKGGETCYRLDQVITMSKRDMSLIDKLASRTYRDKDGTIKKRFNINEIYSLSAFNIPDLNKFMEKYDYYSELTDKNGNRIFNGRNGRMDEASVLGYMASLHDASKEATAVRQLTSLVQDGQVAAHTLKYLPQESHINPLIAQDVRTFYDAYLNHIPLNDVLVPTRESLSDTADLATGDVFEVKGNKNIYIKNQDGTTTQLQMDKATYCKLFPPIERYASTQNAIGNCWQITGFNGLMREPSERRTVLETIKQDGNDIAIQFPNGKLGEVRFKDGKLPEGLDPKFYSEGALGINMLEYAQGCEMQKYVIDIRYNNLQAKLKTASTERERNLIINQLALLSTEDFSKIIYGNKVFYLESKNHGGFDFASTSFRAGGSTSNLWALLGYKNITTLDIVKQENAARTFLTNPENFKTKIVAVGTRGQGEMEVNIQKGIHSGHAYWIRANSDNSGNIKDYELLNPWGITEATLSLDEVIKYCDVIWPADKKNVTPKTGADKSATGRTETETATVNGNNYASDAAYSHNMTEPKSATVEDRAPVKSLEQTLGTVAKDGVREYTQAEINQLKASDASVKQMPNGLVIKNNKAGRPSVVGRLFTKIRTTINTRISHSDSKPKPIIKNYKDVVKMLSGLKDAYGIEYTSKDIKEILNSLPAGVEIEGKDVYALMTLPEINKDLALDILTATDSPAKWEALKVLVNTNDKTVTPTSGEVGKTNEINALEIENIMDNLRICNVTDIAGMFQKLITNNDRIKLSDKPRLSTFLDSVSYYIQNDSQKDAMNHLLEKYNGSLNPITLRYREMSKDDLFFIAKKATNNKISDAIKKIVDATKCADPSDIKNVLSDYDWCGFGRPQEHNYKDACRYALKAMTETGKTYEPDDIAKLFSAIDKTTVEQKGIIMNWSRIHDMILRGTDLPEITALLTNRYSIPDDSVVTRRIKNRKYGYDLATMVELKTENEYQDRAVDMLLDNNSSRKFEALAVKDIIANVNDSASLAKLEQLIQNPDITTHQIIQALSAGTVAPEQGNTVGSVSGQADTNIVKDLIGEENAKSLEFGHLYALTDFYNESPKRFQKMKDSGLFDLIREGKIDEQILGNLEPHRFFSNRTLNDIRKIRDNEPVVKTLSSEAELADISNHVANGDVCEVNGKLYVNEGGKATEIKLSREKFEQLFPPLSRVSFEQKNLGDCWLVTTLDNFMDLPLGRSTLYKLFEQRGNDIYIKFPNGENSIKFPNGEVLDAHGKQIGGFSSEVADGIRMIEQAYAIHRNKKYDTGMPVTDISKYALDTQSLMLELKGGWQYEAVKEIFGEDFTVDSYGTNLDNRENMKQYIQKYANDKNTLLFFATRNTINGHDTPLAEEYDLYGSHAYSIKGYNEKTGMVYITNPWHTSVISEIPMYELIKYIDDVNYAQMKTP